MKINIGMDEHVFVCGGTGSGKTILCEVYLANVPSMVIKLDSKLECFEKLKKNKPVWYGLNNEDVQIIERLEELPSVTKKRIIYAPITEEMNHDFYNALGEWVYEKGDCILWIDEMMSVAESALKYPFTIKKLLTRGRFKNSVCWICTQRPTDIPLICISNANHIFCFNTGLEADRVRMVKNTGCKDFYQILDKHIFLYNKVGQQKAVKATLNL